MLVRISIIIHMRSTRTVIRVPRTCVSWVYIWMERGSGVVPLTMRRLLCTMCSFVRWRDTVLAARRPHPLSSNKVPVFCALWLVLQFGSSKSNIFEIVYVVHTVQQKKNTQVHTVLCCINVVHARCILNIFSGCVYVCLVCAYRVLHIASGTSW